MGEDQTREQLPSEDTDIQQMQWWTPCGVYSVHNAPTTSFWTFIKINVQSQQEMTWDTKTKAYEIIEGNFIDNCVSYRVVEEYHAYRSDFVEEGS